LDLDNLLTTDEGIKGRILTKEQAAKRLGTSYRNLGRWISARIVPFINIRGCVVFNKDYLEYEDLPKRREDLVGWRKKRFFKESLAEGDEKINWILSAKYQMLQGDYLYKAADIMDIEEKRSLSLEELEEKKRVWKKVDECFSKIDVCIERVISSENLRIKEFFSHGEPVAVEKKEVSDVTRVLPQSAETKTTEVKK